MPKPPEMLTHKQKRNNRAGHGEGMKGKINRMWPKTQQLWTVLILLSCYRNLIKNRSRSSHCLRAAPSNECDGKDEWEEGEKNVRTHALSDIPRFMAFANSCWNRPEMRSTLKMCPISSQLRTWVLIYMILNDSQKITQMSYSFPNDIC